MAQGKTLNELTGATSVNQQDLLIIYQTGSTLNVPISALTENIINTSFTGGTMSVTGTSSFEGNVTINVLNVTGSTIFSDSITGQSGTFNDITITGTTTISGNTEIGGNVRISNDLIYPTPSVVPSLSGGSYGTTGTTGTISWDSDYIYVCVATNTWKRAQLSTW